MNYGYGVSIQELYYDIILNHYSSKKLKLIEKEEFIHLINMLIKVVYCQDHRVFGKTTWRGDRETYHTTHLPSLHARTLVGALL